MTGQISEHIRRFVDNEFIRPARERGATRIRLKSSEIQQRMGLAHGAVAVAGALDSKAFVSACRVTTIRRHGPKFGSGAEWVVQVLPHDREPVPA